MGTLITNSNVIEKITNPIQMNNLIQFSLDLKQSKENRSILSKELGLGNSYYKRKFDRLTGTPFKKNKKKKIIIINEKKSNIIMNNNNNNNTPPSKVSSFDVFSLHQNFSTTLNEKKEKKQLLNGSNILLKYFNTIQSCCFLSPGEKDLQCLILNADQLNEFKGFFKTSIGKVRFRPYKDLYIFTYVYLTALENFKTSWMKEDKEDWKKFNDIECEKFLKEFKKWYKGKEMPVEHSCDRASCQRNLHCKFGTIKTNIENRDCIGYALIKEGENSLLKINVCNHLNQCHRATLITNSNVIEKITNPIQMNNLIQFSLDLKQS